MATASTVELKIQRFDPERDNEPHWQTLTVPVEPMDRVLDVLTRAKELFDGSITFRRSCAHGVCGSDALLINGRNRLACKLRVEQLGKTITVAPLPGLPIVKDLVVDMDGFFEKYRSVQPYLVASPVEGSGERIQSEEQRDRFDDTTKCILCAACTTSCPSFWAEPEYVGPAAIVNAHRFIFDSRDENAEARLDILSDEDGVWRCRTTFNCVEACPRGINITKAILEVSSAISSRE
jgi:succinate dehydrogenase / fumarate reductase iron-sulfur subunit